MRCFTVNFCHSIWSSSESPLLGRFRDSLTHVQVSTCALHELGMLLAQCIPTQVLSVAIEPIFVVQRRTRVPTQLTGTTVLGGEDGLAHGAITGFVNALT